MKTNTFDRRIKGRQPKLSSEILDLIRERREPVNATASERQVLDKEMKKRISHDIRLYNA